MSDAASIEDAVAAEAAIISKAAAGELPGWAVAGPARRAHSARVAELLESWARALGFDEGERRRWRAVGWLHDALRDAPYEMLRTLVPTEFSELPGPLLHGPAAAALLRKEGVTDSEILSAITYHTVGHPDLGLLGQALFMADALEPGRRSDPTWSAALRARLPDSFDDILLEVTARHLEHLLRRRLPLRPETIAFWHAQLQRS